MQKHLVFHLANHMLTFMHVVFHCNSAGFSSHVLLSFLSVACMASQAWQKWVELKITYRVSVIDVWDWEITVRDWKITTWEYKNTVWEIKTAIREWKTVMRDHNYQSRMKNCHVRSILTVDKEKSLCDKKKSPFEIIDWFFSEPARHIQSAESILAGFSLILRSV